MTDDRMSTHRVHYRVDLPEGDRLEQWDHEPCDCDLGTDHDLGQELYK